ncbi:MAG: hypothetical protein O2807_06675 [bacterium]|nr:hypothetical protein [bacterium]
MIGFEEKCATSGQVSEFRSWEEIFVYRAIFASALIIAMGAGALPAAAAEKQKTDGCLTSLYNYPAEYRAEKSSEAHIFRHDQNKAEKNLSPPRSKSSRKKIKTAPGT